MRRYLIALGAFLVIAAVWTAPRIVVVPAASGIYEQAAQRVLDAGLRVTAVSASGTPLVPQGTEAVIAQSPRAGSVSVVGNLVTVSITPPRHLVAVPDVVGLHVSAAIGRVHRAGLNLGGPSGVGLVTRDDGIIATTTPAPGELVPFGSSVFYELSQ